MQIHSQLTSGSSLDTSVQSGLAIIWNNVYSYYADVKRKDFTIKNAEIAWNGYMTCTSSTSLYCTTIIT